MKRGGIDWNDPVSEFIRVKLRKPEVLNQLVRREQQCADKKSTQHKMEALRGKFEELSLKFRIEQRQYQFKVEMKRQLQKDVIKIGNAIKKLQVEFEKMAHQPAALPFRHSGKDYKEEPTRYSVNSDEFSIKKHQEQLASIMADQGSLKDSLHKDVQKLVAKRISLTQDLQNSTVKLQRMVYKKQLRQSYEQKRQVLEQTKMMVQLEQRKRKSLLYTLSEQDEKSSRLRNSLQSVEDDIQKSNRKMQNFTKEKKKLLMNEESRQSRKYKEFIKKYRIYSREQEQELRTSYNRILERGDANLRLSALSSTSSPEKNKENYEDLLVQVMKKFSSKKFSSEEFKGLEEKCIKLNKYCQYLLEEEEGYTAQLQSLQQNLQRKTRQVKQMKKSPMYKFKSL